MQQLLNYMGGPGPNRPKTTLREKRERKTERKEERQQNPTKRKGTNIRCNTDQRAPKKEQEIDHQ